MFPLPLLTSPFAGAQIATEPVATTTAVPEEVVEVAPAAVTAPVEPEPETEAAPAVPAVVEEPAKPAAPLSWAQKAATPWNHPPAAKPAAPAQRAAPAAKPAAAPAKQAPGNAARPGPDRPSRGPTRPDGPSGGSGRPGRPHDDKPRAPLKPGCSVYVKNLPDGVTAVDIIEAFTVVGAVRKGGVSIHTPQRINSEGTDEPAAASQPPARKYAFVEFLQKESLERCLSPEFRGKVRKIPYFY